MKIFEGVYTALITPFTSGAIDYDSLKCLIESQIASGIVGFVVNGTTAESPTLTEEEQLSLLEYVKKISSSRVKIIFGSGSNCTKKTIALSQKAEAVGVDGLLVVVPYYNKPPQEGLYQHFSQVACAVKTPVMLYNVPGRTVTSLSIDTICKLAKVENIVAIKEASGNIEFAEELISKLSKDFIVSSGDDETCLDLRRVGGRGVVSVCSHILPKQVVKWFTGEVSPELISEFEGFKELISSLYIAPNPVPVKSALQTLGIINSADVRLPLVTLNKGHKRSLDKKLSEFKGQLI